MVDCFIINLEVVSTKKKSFLQRILEYLLQSLKFSYRPTGDSFADVIHLGVDFLLKKSEKYKINENQEKSKIMILMIFSTISS